MGLEIQASSGHTDESPVVLEVDSLGLTYLSDQGVEVETLRDISFQIRKSEFVALVGPSGCGKSTLLNIIAGFLHQTSGRILIEGKPIGPPDRHRGMTFQTPSLYPWKTALKNVLFGLELTRHEARLSRPGRLARAREVLRQVELDGSEDKYPHELSGGMLQRLELAQDLVMQPKIHLMDEPFSALDAQTRENLQLLILHIHQQLRNTVLFVTHDLDEALFVADRVLVMGPRPATIRLDQTVPDYQSLDVKATPEFAALKRQILKEFDR